MHIALYYCLGNLERARQRVFRLLSVLKALDPDCYRHAGWSVLPTVHKQSEVTSWQCDAVCNDDEKRHEVPEANLSIAMGETMTKTLERLRRWIPAHTPEVRRVVMEARVCCRHQGHDGLPLLHAVHASPHLPASAAFRPKITPPFVRQLLQIMTQLDHNIDSIDNIGIAREPSLELQAHLQTYNSKFGPFTDIAA